VTSYSEDLAADPVLTAVENRGNQHLVAKALTPAQSRALAILDSGKLIWRQDVHEVSISTARALARKVERVTIEEKVSYYNSGRHGFGPRRAYRDFILRVTTFKYCPCTGECLGPVNAAADDTRRAERAA